MSESKRQAGAVKWSQSAGRSSRCGGAVEFLMTSRGGTTISVPPLGGSSDRLMARSSVLRASARESCDTVVRDSDVDWESRVLS